MIRVVLARTGADVDLTNSESEKAFRAEARAWLEANVPRDLPPLDSPEGFPLHVAWERKLFENRWAVVSWPRAYGGGGAAHPPRRSFRGEEYREDEPEHRRQQGSALLLLAVNETTHTCA